MFEGQAASFEHELGALYVNGIVAAERVVGADLGPVRNKCADYTGVLPNSAI